MNGHILHNTNIAVDYWKIQGRCGNLIHFLTHLHGDHIVGLTPSWQQPIYCSEFTSELLKSKHGLSESLMRVCPISQSIIVRESSSKSFTVTAFDADHCPGAVMFYFQGGFGNILYTGDCRSSSQVIDSCRHLVGKVDTLYLDNTFCSPKCVFPSREECLMSIIQIVRQHPQHHVVIGVRKLGKELLLAKLGVVLDETICVSPSCYQMSQLLFTTNVFTTVALSDGQSRIRTVPFHVISRKFIENLNRTRPTIAIIPSAIYTGLDCKPFSRDPNIFVVPYSDHSSFLELYEFVSTLRPAKVLPIVRHFRGPFGLCLGDREDMSCFQSTLSKGRSGMYDSDENRTHLLNQSSARGNGHSGFQSESCLLTEISDTVESSKPTAWSPLVMSISNQKHLQKKRKQVKSVSRCRKRTAKGVVYVNTENKLTGRSDSVSDGGYTGAGNRLDQNHLLKHRNSTAYKVDDSLVESMDSPEAHLSIDDPAMSHLSIDDPAMSHLSVDDPAMSHLSTDDPAMSHLSIDDPAMSHLSIDDPAMSHLSIDDPAVSHLSIDDPAMSHLSIDDPAMSHLSTDDPAMSHLSTDVPAVSHDVCAVTEDTCHGVNCLTGPATSPQKYVGLHKVMKSVSGGRAAQSSQVPHRRQCSHVRLSEQHAGVCHHIIDHRSSRGQSYDVTTDDRDTAGAQLARRGLICTRAANFHTTRHPFRAMATTFRPKDLCAPFKFPRKHPVFDMPARPRVTHDLIAFLDKFIRKNC